MHTRFKATIQITHNFDEAVWRRWIKVLIFSIIMWISR